MYADKDLIEDFDAPEFWCSRVAKVEFASAGVLRITFGSERMGRLTPACSVLIPVENTQRSIDLWQRVAEQIAVRAHVYVDVREMRAH